jgi:micrococcal nuclease
MKNGRRIVSLVLFLALAAGTGYPLQDIYSCRSPDGTTTYSDHVTSDCPNAERSSYSSLPDAEIRENKSLPEVKRNEQPKPPKAVKEYHPEAKPEEAPIRPKAAVRVNKVIDGDTIEVKIGNDLSRVRLIGIDCPEASQKYGKEATGFTKSFLSFGNAELEFDVQIKDRYGRLLAYVWSGDEMLNSLLVKNGLAVVTTYPPNVKYVDLFKKLQETARIHKEGLWKFGGLEQTPYEFRKRSPKLLTHPRASQ